MDGPAAHKHNSFIRGREAVMIKAKVEGALHGPFFYSKKKITQVNKISEPSVTVMSFWAKVHPLNSLIVKFA